MFKIQTNGTDFSILYSFSGGSDGRYPTPGLVLSGDRLYGTTRFGGSSDGGTVFAVNTDGTGFTNLAHFNAASVPRTNSTGATPRAGLVLSGNTLYGTTQEGGSFGGAGTVFKVNTDGTGFTVLHSFSYYSDGAVPLTGLILSANTLFGTAYTGGSASGTVFAMKTDGTGFTNLYSFTAVPSYPGPYTNADGAGPFGKLLLSSNTLYGTADHGGSSGRGTVFSLSLATDAAPRLTIIPSGVNFVLVWPTNTDGFILQSASILPGPFTNISGATSPYTNVISGGQQFFRLISN